MKKVDLKTKKSVLKCTFIMMVLMLVMPLLLTNCGTQKAATAYDDAEPQSPEYELTDDCALLHIYRPGSMAGMAISYTLRLDDEEIFRVKNKSKTTIRFTGGGAITLWAKTETKTELSMDIQLGKEYYVRCGVGMGAFVGRPKIEIVDNEKGQAEFNKIPAKK
ncbi:MAG: DUF2846 domain-containing protein [Dysgonamonadaceae bacterium]|jgi:hypothetical protein|nr:DUF2846 domain-containing protein [Dysgonamonadaceae bacterium]